MNNIDKRLLAYKPISVTLNFDWENTTYDERVQMRHDYIEEQKKLDPNYVGFDFPEWFRSQYGTAANLKIKYYRDPTRVVNTIGQAIGYSRGKLNSTFGLEHKSGYLRIKIKRGKDRMDVAAHRIIASTFIPIPEELKNERYKLVVNHKNDIKSCNLKNNLEWNTQLMNVHNALKTGVMSSSGYKMVVDLPGKLYKKVYYFARVGELETIGLLQATISNVVIKGLKYLHSFWYKVNTEELKGKETGITSEDFNILVDPKYGQSNARAVVGTIVSDGPCKGERFCFFGSGELEKNGFYSTACWRIAKRNTGTYRGCTWTLMSRHDASEIPIGLTKEQKLHIGELKDLTNK